MFLFVIITSCTALKLSDPASLRDVTEENISLRAWCAGVGCVMPFTPASCLSWCDWNFDKQSDAEARGAFAGTHWGEKKQKKATDFGFLFADSFVNTNECASAGTHKEFFMDPSLDHSSKAANHVPIFPGGDTEKLTGDTYLECDHCYAVQALTNGAVFNADQWHVKFTKAATVKFGGATGGASRVLIYTYDQTKKCGTDTDIRFTFDVAALTTGTKGKKTKDKMEWTTGTAAACKKMTVKDMVKTVTERGQCDAVSDAAAKAACLVEVNKENGVSTADKHTNMVAGTQTDIGFGLMGGLMYPTCA